MTKPQQICTRVAFNIKMIILKSEASDIKLLLNIKHNSEQLLQDTESKLLNVVKHEKTHKLDITIKNINGFILIYCIFSITIYPPCTFCHLHLPRPPGNHHSCLCLSSFSFFLFCLIPLSNRPPQLSACYL